MSLIIIQLLSMFRAAIMQSRALLHTLYTLKRLSRCCFATAAALLLQADYAGVLLEAMRIAMSHPAVSKGPTNLCAAACTCAGLRQAVQQCSASIAITLQLTAPLEQLQSFRSWLPKHAALVDSISAKADVSGNGISTPFTMHSTLWQPHVEAAQRLLEQAL
jgi:hypothetical protein